MASPICRLTEGQFPISAHHLASWAVVCPGNRESAGKQKSGRARTGNIHLRTILVGAAISASPLHTTCSPRGSDTASWAKHLDRAVQTGTVANLKRRLERLGYHATLKPKAGAA